ncbi:MAG: hydrogenase maturation protease [candidate division WOR-3 bacterium]
MKKLIIGMGNEYYGNDALGIIVARKLRETLPEYDLKTGAFSGVDFLEAIEEYDEVIVIDSIVNPDKPIGDVVELKVEDFAGLKSFSYLHSMSFASAIELGRQLKLKLPEKIKIFGIVVDKKGEIGEELSPHLRKELESMLTSIRKML